jgi:hypothetical protein
MKPTRCPTCHCDELTHGRLSAHIGVNFRLSLFMMVGVSGATCLACGAIIPYLDDAALTKVQAWNRTTKSMKPAINEL